MAQELLDFTKRNPILNEPGSERMAKTMEMDAAVLQLGSDNGLFEGVGYPFIKDLFAI